MDTNNQDQPQQEQQQGQPQQTPSTSGITPQQDFVFGTFKTIADAEKGYKDAREKIREMGTQLKQYQPAGKDIFTKAGWEENVASMEKFKDTSVPFDDPSVQTLLAGAKEAGISKNQINSMLSSMYDNQQNRLATIQDEFERNLGVEDRNKLDKLNTFKQNLSQNDQEIFDSIASAPFLNPKQIDLLDRLLTKSNSAPLPNVKENTKQDRIAELIEAKNKLDFNQAGALQEWVKFDKELASLQD